MSGIYKSADGERTVRERYLEILKHWPVPNSQLRLSTREGETFVVACGDEKAPPLLLFHGAMANSALWMGDVPALAARFRIFAVDLIGEPGLSAPSRPSRASEAYALWLDEVLQGLSLARVSIVGVSAGGWLALDYATRRPECVASLAVLCPAGVGPQKASLLWKTIPLMLLGRWGRGKALQVALGRTPRNPNAAARPLAEFMGLVLAQFRPNRAQVPIFSDQALQRLNMPVMAILGGRDAMLDSAATRRRLEQNVPQAEIRYLPETGHFIPAQTTAILEFLLAAASVPSR